MKNLLKHHREFYRNLEYGNVNINRARVHYYCCKIYARGLRSYAKTYALTTVIPTMERILNEYVG
jgi:hypothetical protein